MYRAVTPISNGTQVKYVGDFAYFVASCVEFFADEFCVVWPRFLRFFRSNRNAENFAWMGSGGLAVAFIYEYFLGLGWL